MSKEFNGRTYKPLVVRKARSGGGGHRNPNPRMAINLHKGKPHKLNFNIKASEEMRKNGFRVGMFLNAYQTSDGYFALMHGSEYLLRSQTNCSGMLISNVMLAEAIAETATHYEVKCTKTEVLLKPIKEEQE